MPQFILVSLIGHWVPSSPELEGYDRKRDKAPIIQWETVSDPLHHLNVHKSMWPDGIHPRVLKEMAEEFVKPLSVIYHQSWLTGEVPADWRLANVISICKKDRKEDPQNYMLVIITSVLEKVMKQIILNVI